MGQAAIEYLSGRIPSVRGTYNPYQDAPTANLMRWKKTGFAEVSEVINHRLYDSATNTYYILLGLHEGVNDTYSWVRQQLPPTQLYSQPTGVFWDANFPSVSELTPPFVMREGIDLDPLFKHTTDAFDRYIQSFGGKPAEGFSPICYGTSAPTNLTRWMIDNAEFDVVEEEVVAVFYKNMADGRKEWHAFVRGVGKKLSMPSRNLFDWTPARCPGDLYDNSGLIRTGNSVFVQEY